MAVAEGREEKRRRETDVGSSAVGVVTGGDKTNEYK
jgi:hypothetical protein